MTNNVTTGTVIDGYTSSIAQLWGSGPKLTIRCNGCQRFYEKRIAAARTMVAICPNCGRLNKLNVTST